jgi:SAM-dependent methyltransferase
MDVTTRGWYKKWFGNEYLTLYAHRDDKEAAQVVTLLLSHISLHPRARILDLCCGQGRHVSLLARHGYSVFGVDLSRTLLEIAKFKKNPDARAHFIQADMRFLPAYKKFDLLINLFTSFGYFHEDQQNQLVFHQFQETLKPGAHFLFDYLNSHWIYQNLQPYHKETVGSIVVEQERQIIGDRVVKKIVLHHGDKPQIYHESVRMYDPDTLLEMLTKASLETVKIFGDYTGADFEIKSPRFIVLGKKQFV